MVLGVWGWVLESVLAHSRLLPWCWAVMIMTADRSCECHQLFIAADLPAVAEVSVSNFGPSNFVVFLFLYKWVELVLD